MNIKLLKRIQRIILRRHDEFDIGKWFSRPTETCGTTACIAGWTLTLQRREKKKKANPYKTYLSIPSLIGIQGHAAAILQLNLAQSDRLFYSAKWPEQFQTDYFNTSDSKKRAEITFNRIQHFIDTNGEE